MRKGILKRALALTLAVSLMGAFVVAPWTAVAASEGGYDEYQGSPVIEGEFYYGSRLGDGEIKTSKFYYSDGYFAGSSSDYDDHLATMSFNLAASTYFEDYTVGILDETGFRDICVSSGFDNEPTIDSVGDAIGHKTINVSGKESTLVAVAVRGHNYGLELVSNLMAGSKGDHKGFAESADKVKADIDEYISQTGIDKSNVKFWLTGYSRGGVVADLLAKTLTDEYSADAVYSYSFAAPKAVSTDNNPGSVTNSHVVINKYDPMSYLIPEQMGFSHYGTVTDLAEKTSFDSMLYELSRVDGSISYTNKLKFYDMDISGLFKSDDNVLDQPVEDITTKDLDSLEEEDIEDLVIVNKEKISNNVFDKLKKKIKFPELSGVNMSMDEFYTLLTQVIVDDMFKTREEFSTEKPGKATMSPEEVVYAFSKSYIEADESEEVFKNIIDSFSGKKIDDSDIMKIVSTVIGGFDYSIYAKDHQAFYDLTWDLVKDAFEENLSNDEVSVLEEGWPTVVEVIIKIAHNLLNDYKNLSSNGLSVFSLIGTCAENLETFGKGHSVQIYLSWLRACDDFYVDGDGDLTYNETVFLSNADKLNAEISIGGKTVATISEGRMTASGDARIMSRSTNNEKESLGSLLKYKDDIREITVIPGETMSITFTPTEDNFSGWKNADGEIVSTEPEYTVEVTDDSNITYLEPAYGASDTGSILNTTSRVSMIVISIISVVAVAMVVVGIAKVKKR